MFVRFRLYHMFDPDAAEFRGRNAYRLACVLLIAFVQCSCMFGTLGFVAGTADGTVSHVDAFLVAMSQVQVHQCTVKIALLLARADTVWSALDVARLRFLRSRPCRDRADMLHRYRDRAAHNARLYVTLIAAVFGQWIAFPLAYNAFAAPLTRPAAVLGWRYPVTARAGHRYYAAFYALESVICLFCLYCVVVVDTLLVSLGWAVVAQYRVVCAAFGAVGRAPPPRPADRSPTGNLASC